MMAGASVAVECKDGSIFGGILLEACITVNSANHNSRGKFLVVTSLRMSCTKCETEK